MSQALCFLMPFAMRQWLSIGIGYGCFLSAEHESLNGFQLGQRKEFRSSESIMTRSLLEQSKRRQFQIG
jgi:hypothetical protein